MGCLIIDSTKSINDVTPYHTITKYRKMLFVTHTILAVRMPTTWATASFFFHYLLRILVIGDTPTAITVPSTRTTATKFGINGF